MQSAEPVRLFAALGEPTRMALVLRLSDGARLSISALSAAAPISRQALTKHLRVLEDAGVVTSSRSGREMLFELDPQAVRRAGKFLSGIEAQWDERLQRLKRFVEAD